MAKKITENDFNAFSHSVSPVAIPKEEKDKV
jgi:hypothetical protein